MKRFFLMLAMVVICTPCLFAQSSENEKFQMSVDAGVGMLLGNSNISSYGANYRKDFNSGFILNVRTNYRVDDCFLVGLKLSNFIAGENLSTELGAIPEDVELYYIAPQFGMQYKFAEKWTYEQMIGAGYVHYGSNSLMKDVERKCSRGFMGANLDLIITRHLFKNIYLGAGASLMLGQTSKLTEKMGGQKRDIELGKFDKIKLDRADFYITIKGLI